MYRWYGSPFRVFFHPDPVGAGAGSSGAAGAATGAGAGTGTSAGAGAGAGAGTGTPDPTGAAAGTNGQPNRYSYDQEFGGRSNWIDPNDPRIANWERVSREAQQAATARDQAERYRRMLEAGTGVNIREQRELPQEIQEARESFGRVYPELAQLASNPQLMQRLTQLLQSDFDPQMLSRLPDAVYGADYIWEQRGRTALQAIETEIAKDYGGELNAFQRRMAGAAFMDWLQEDPTRQSRYISQDPKLTTEFLSAYRTGFVDPLRRSAQAGDAGQANRNQQLPGAPRGTGMPAGGGNNNNQPLTEDQVHDNAWKGFQAARRAASGM